MFKVGDKVFDNERGYGEGEITNKHCDGWIVIKFSHGIETYRGDGRWISQAPITLFKKEEKMTYTLEQWKKFHTEIEAYEKGEAIEIWSEHKEEWVYHTAHSFFTSMEYRIKPKLTREEITANWVAENNLKVGDKIKVVKGFEEKDAGFYIGDSGICIGDICKVREIMDNRIRVNHTYEWYAFPVESLEKVVEEWIPFSYEDYSLFMQKLVKRKGTKRMMEIYLLDDNIFYFDQEWMTFETGLKLLEFVDNTPFGKLKQ